jgi:hypothetical protein
MYERHTPGVAAKGSGTIILDDLSEPEPDAALHILPECGGQTRLEGRYDAGAPELVTEISLSSKEVDLGAKLKDYERAGVLEYVVVVAEPAQVIWHERRDNKLVVVTPTEDGLYHSTVFPGLWLDPRALLADDLKGLLEALDRGLATPEHAAFVARLAQARQTP